MLSWLTQLPTGRRFSASSTPPMIQPMGVDKEGSTASAMTGWRLEAAVQWCRAQGDLGTNFADRYYRSSQLRRGGRNWNVTPSAPPDRTELEDLEVGATFRIGGRSQPLCPLHRVFAEGAWQRQRHRSASLSGWSSRISDASYADTVASMSELASSDVRLTESTNGSDDAMTDVEENVPSAGQVTGSVSSELPPILQLQPMFLVQEAR